MCLVMPQICYNFVAISCSAFLKNNELRVSFFVCLSQYWMYTAVKKGGNGIFRLKTFGGFGTFAYLCTENQIAMGSEMFKRKIYSKMLAWKDERNGRTALLLSSMKCSSRYQVASVLGDSERKNLMGVLADMKDSMVVNFAYHANDPNVGLSLHSDESFYKMYMGDTGLFITLAFWDMG